MAGDEKQETQQGMTFLQVLATLNDAQALPEIEEKLKELTEAVLSTEKKGSLVLTLNLAPAGVVAGCRALNITDVITVRKPTASHTKETFFVSAKLDLARNTFKQAEIGFPALVKPGEERETPQAKSA